MNVLLRLLPLLVLIASAPPAQAAPACSGYVTSLPTTIATAGVWCLSQDLGTSLASGNAIRLGTHNITLDCQGFRINGLAAGAASQAVGVAVSSKLNGIVRNCNIRGFQTGIAITGGLSGHIVEDNRLDGATSRGIFVDGDASVVRRNNIVDVGGSTVAPGYAAGIVAVGTVDIDDNLVDGVEPLADAGGDRSASGIAIDQGSAAAITGNRVRRIVGGGEGNGAGIRITGAPGVVFHDNVIGDSDVGGECADAGSVAFDNDFSYVTTPLLGCRDDGNRVTP